MIAHHLQLTNRWIIRLAGIVLCVGTVVTCAVIKETHETLQGAPLLWHRAEFSGEAPVSQETVRIMAITIEVFLLASADNARFSLLLPDGGSLTVVKAGQEQVGERGFFWHGKVEKDSGSFVTFSVVNNSVMGTVLTSTGKFYRLRSGKGSVRFIEEVNPAKIPRYENDVTPNTMSKRDDTQAKPVLVCNDGRQIDVLVIYTTNAKLGACSDAGKPANNCTSDEIENTVTMAVGETITSYSESAINLEINLLPITEVTYTEQNNLSTDIGNLTSGYIKDKNGTAIAYRDTGMGVPTSPSLRDQNHYAADAVILIVETSSPPGTVGPSGLGNQMNEIQCTLGDPHCAPGDTQSWYAVDSRDTKFAAVVVREWATSFHLGYAFAHELGHVLGARHEWANQTEVLQYDPDTGIPVTNHAGTYNHGHVEPPLPTMPGWYTIMAYGVIDYKQNEYCTPCNHVPLWSNPNKNYGGVQTGLASGPMPEDNARRLNDESAPIVANYYCHKMMSLDPNPPIIFNVDSENISFNSADITWITNKSSTSQVDYGTVANQYVSHTVLNSILVTSHTVSLSGLVPSTVYHYRVSSTDAAGKLSFSGDYSFTTLPAPDTTPPAPPSGLRVQ